MAVSLAAGQPRGHGGALARSRRRRQVVVRGSRGVSDGLGAERVARDENLRLAAGQRAKGIRPSRITPAETLPRIGQKPSPRDVKMRVNLAILVNILCAARNGRAALGQSTPETSPLDAEIM